MINLSLYVPGLFDAVPAAEDGQQTTCAALELMLARARKVSLAQVSQSAALCQLFGYRHEGEDDIPMAAIGRLMDDEKRPQGYWMRADPVHLHADQRSLRLLDISNLSLTQHDALALAACVQPSFTALGWELEVPVPTRWYVKLDGKPAIRTFDINSVLGEDIQAYMPVGADAATWHRLMNEIQMQLHDADINTLRVERGELPINSLWLWGSGSLPGLLERRWTRVYSDDNNTMGLAMLSNTPCFPLPESGAEIFREDDKRANLLLVLSEFQTRMLQAGQGQEQIDKFESNWCAVYLDALQEGKLHSLRIISRSQEFIITRYSLKKFWKTSRPLHYYAS